MRSGQAAVRLVAPGGPRVERPVGDHLERPHGHEPVRSREHVAGAQALGDRGVEVLRPHRGDHPQPALTRRQTPPPRRRRAAPLEVDHADDAPGRGGRRSLGHPGVRHALRRLLDAVEHREPGVLADQTRRAAVGAGPGHSVALGRGGVEPAAVQVTRDEDHGDLPADPVEHGRRRLVRPQRVPEPGAHQRHPGGRLVVPEPCADERRGVRGRGRGGHVETPPGERPLRHVGVRVPQARDQPPPVEVDHLGRPGRVRRPGRDHPGRRDRVGRRDHAQHPAVGDPHVDQRLGCPAPGEVDEAGTTQDGGGHPCRVRTGPGRRVPVRSRVRRATGPGR